MSIISDSFPKERRAAPIGVYAAAAAVGAGLAMIVGGTVIQLVSHRNVFELPLVGEVERWQAAFILVGVGGLALLPLLATILEPVRRNELAVAGTTGAAPHRQVHSPARGLHGSSLCGRVVLFGRRLRRARLGPVHFIRVHGWSAGETGLRYGIVLLLFGGAGTVLGGMLSAHLGKRGVAQPAIWITVVGMAVAGPLLAAAGLANDGWSSLTWYAPALLFMTLPGGTAIQVVQEAVPNRLRGQASALYYLSTSIVGNTLGPLSVGMLTDYVYGDPLRIGSALAILAIVIAPLTSLLALSTRAPFARLVGQQATA
jgi:MFS family permease